MGGQEGVGGGKGMQGKSGGGGESAWLAARSPRLVKSKESPQENVGRGGAWATSYSSQQRGLCRNRR